MAEMTPMMRQYMEIKEQNKDSILFFRLGDFYEMFGDDARKASRELDLTLTTRDKDKNKSFEEKIPMCGIPYHASDAYIARLIAKGYKVAICEQTEDPAAAKGLVERDIVRIVTPGTVIDSACLEEGRSNFCAGIYLDGDYAGFSVCDISTGQTHVTAFSGPDREAHLQNELGRFAPAEAVLNPGAAGDAALRALLEDLAALKVAECVDFRPSDDAVTFCGFQDPVTLTVHYQTATGIEGIFEMNVGTQNMGGTGRYVRFGDEPAIYLMELELLDPMMRLAYQGMEEAS